MYTAGLCEISRRLHVMMGCADPIYSGVCSAAIHDQENSLVQTVNRIVSRNIQYHRSVYIALTCESFCPDCCPSGQRAGAAAARRLAQSR